MADIKLIIKIPESQYEYLAHLVNAGHEPLGYFERVIMRGTPLPKGHGRLIDISDIEWAKHREERDYIDYEVVDWDDIVNAPTIIEADKKSEEE